MNILDTPPNEEMPLSPASQRISQDNYEEWKDASIFTRGAAMVLALLLVTAVGTVLLKTHHTHRVDVGVGTHCSGVCTVNEGLVCLDGACHHCKSDLMCQHTNPNSFCNDENTCQHKHVMPLNSDDAITFIITVATVAVASGGGMGGGGVLVAIFILVSKFTAYSAVPLSNLTMFGAATYNFMHFAGMRHPTANKPRIDYDIAIVLEPMTLAGTTAGVIFNRILPEWCILLVLLIVLGGMWFRTTSYAVRLWGLEEARPVGETTPLLRVGGVTVVPTRVEPLTPSEHTMLGSLLKSESKTFPPSRIAALVMLWFILFVISYFRGGHGRTGYVHCGSSSYWYLFVMVFPICILITFLFGRHLLSMHKRKLVLKYPFQPGDALWTRRNTVLYPLACTFAGMVAGMLGVSGGLIKGPLLLEWGVLPQVQAATTAFMVLFTSSCASVQYFIIGHLDVQYACLYFVLGFIAALIGQNVMGWLVQEYNRTSFIVFSLSIILFASVVCVGYVGVERLIAHHGFDGFHQLCR